MSVEKPTRALVVVLIEACMFSVPLGVWNDTGGLDNMDVGCRRGGPSACSERAAGKGCGH